MAFGIAELQAASPGLLAGITTTLEIVAIAVAGGMVIGTLLALARLSPFKILSLPAKLYVNFFRSVPLLLVLMQHQRHWAVRCMWA